MNSVPACVFPARHTVVNVADTCTWARSREAGASGGITAAVLTRALTQPSRTKAAHPPPPPVPAAASLRYEAASAGVEYGAIRSTQALGESRKLAVRSATNHATATPCGVRTDAAVTTTGPAE